MKKFRSFASILVLSIITLLTACNTDVQQQESDSGVKKATVKIKTDLNGNTVEQRNLTKRLVRDNEIGSIKHLYVISSFSGSVLEYSTVVGKVTSGNKRLSPKTVNGNGYNTYGATNYVTLNGENYTSDEVLDDGGAYGDSGAYLFWFDAQDNYHQYYPSGGTYLTISDRPLRIHKSDIAVSIEEPEAKPAK